MNARIAGENNVDCIQTCAHIRMYVMYIMCVYVRVYIIITCMP